MINLLSFLKKYTPVWYFEKKRENYPVQMSREDILRFAEDCSNKLPWGRNQEFRRLYDEAKSEV